MAVGWDMPSSTTISLQLGPRYVRPLDQNLSLITLSWCPSSDCCQCQNRYFCLSYVLFSFVLSPLAKAMAFAEEDERKLRRGRDGKHYQWSGKPLVQWRTNVKPSRHSSSPARCYMVDFYPVSQSLQLTPLLLRLFFHNGVRDREACAM